MTDSTKSICLPTMGNRNKKNKNNAWIGLSELVWEFFRRCISLIVLILLSPLLLFIGLLVRVCDGEPVFFCQKRVGKTGKEFVMYKFRTMYVGAEKDRDKYIKDNEADGPVFKIDNDPRFSGCGKFLSHSGLDELPQLVNVLKGDMAFVGPRPLPVYEENRIDKNTKVIRRSVLPGIISTWVLKGTHSKNGFDSWMKLDREYVSSKNPIYDTCLFVKAIILFGRLIIRALV